MTRKLKLNGSIVTLDNNQLSGDTYRIKDYIKRECGGKWDGESKTWTVDAEMMTNVLNSGSCYIFPATEATPVVKQTQTANGYCRKCHTYCYGDCES